MKKLLKEINEHNILLEIVDGELKVFARDMNISPALLARIKVQKNELVQFLMTNQQVDFDNPHRINIPIAPDAKNYPLSASQRRLWIASLFEGGNFAYNMAGVHLFEGHLNSAALEYSFNRLIERHEILRTVFKEDEQGEIRQYILSAQNAAFTIMYEDLRKEKGQDEQLKDLINRSMFDPFDLTEGPLLRAGLYQVANTRWVFSYTMHHIISDAWSMDILIKELLLLYNAYTKGEEAQLPPLRIQYKDYATWQQQQLRGDALKDHRAWWLKQLEGELPVLALPGDRVRPAIKTYTGGMISKSMPGKLSKELQSLSQACGGTMFMGLLAAVNTLLYRYTQQEDLIIGTSIASREHADLEDQIGFYVNLLALRIRFKGKDSFLDLLNTVKQVTLGAYEHQVYPFDELVNELDLQRDMSRSGLFDVMVVLQNTGSSHENESRNVADLTVSLYNPEDTVISKFDLTFFFSASNEAIQVNIVYNKDLYNKKRVLLLGDHLEQLLNAIVSDPAKPIAQLDYLTAHEKLQLQVTFAESLSLYPKHKTVIDLFEEQATQTPDNTALVFEGQSLTYRTLKEQTDKLAAYLRMNYDIRANDIIGIMLSRSANMIIALLGILKSGGAYVAIEPETPKGRKEFILKDTGIKALITQSDCLFDLDYYAGNVFAIDIQLEGMDVAYGSPGVHIQPAHLAYVVYTSGSTGQPKGVMIHHQSLVDYFFGITARSNIRNCKSFGLVSTIAADLGNTVIYSSLLTGGVLHVFSANDVLNGERIFETNLDCIKIVPSHWKGLQDGRKLYTPDKCLVFGGEKLTEDVIELIKMNKRSCEVYNHYGPSETTIGKLIHHVDLKTVGANIPLGSPFCNSRVYILDEQSNLQPIGIAGEICIAGDGVAAGYLHHPELTTLKFVPNPFKPGERMYKTGDVGRWLEDGTMEFLGRKDDQVKIRGYRVEPREIEHTLKSHPGIEVAVVLGRSRDAEETELVAYVVCKEVLQKEELQLYVSNKLPTYMLPHRYVFLLKLPLTLNGKIDRKKLQDMEDAQAPGDIEDIPPRTEIEKILVTIWQQVLGREKLGISDNFFDVGGNSLKMVRMVALINKQFGLNISVVEGFKFPNIQALSDYINVNIQHGVTESDEDLHYSVAVMEEAIKLLNQDLNEE